MFRKRREKKRAERVRRDLEQARQIVSEIDSRNAAGTDEEVLAVAAMIQRERLK